MPEVKQTRSWMGSRLSAILRVVVPFAVFSALWIYFSDSLLAKLARDVRVYEFFSISKGMFYVAISATLLYFLLRAEQRARRKAMQQVEKSDQRFREALSNARHVLYRRDLITGKYDYISFSAAEILGIERERLLEEGVKVVMERMNPEDCKRCLELLDGLAEKHAPAVVMEYRIRNGEGEERWFSDSATLVYDPQGKLVALVGGAYDITDRKLLERDRVDLLQREQAARARAEGANRAKDELLAIVSHELRTPLTAIVTATDVLQRESYLQPDGRELLDRITENADLEARLVEDLLDTTRMAQGTMRLELGMVDIHQVLGRVIEDCCLVMRDKKVAIETALDVAGVKIKGDKVRLRQVFWNLLGNAVKFTPDGGKIVISTRMESEAKGSRVVIQIQDTGIGLEAEDLARLFQPFEQVDRSVTRRFGGLGLGLHIARSLVELHGGHLSAISAGRNQGTIFTIELPVLPDVKEPAGGEGKTVREQKPDVLLVEDNRDTLRLLTRLLKGMGYKVLAAENTAAAMELASDNSSCILISDIGLPDRSGWELMHELRQRYGMRGVAISGFSSEDDRQRSREVGFAAHLVKPVNVRELEQVLLELADVVADGV